MDSRARDRGTQDRKTIDGLWQIRFTAGDEVPLTLWLLKTAGSLIVVRYPVSGHEFLLDPISKLHDRSDDMMAEFFCC